MVACRLLIDHGGDLTNAFQSINGVQHVFRKEEAAAAWTNVLTTEVSNLCVLLGERLVAEHTAITTKTRISLSESMLAMEDFVQRIAHVELTHVQHHWINILNQKITTLQEEHAKVVGQRSADHLSVQQLYIHPVGIDDIISPLIKMLDHPFLSL